MRWWFDVMDRVDLRMVDGALLLFLFVDIINIGGYFLFFFSFKGLQFCLQAVD